MEEAIRPYVEGQVVWDLGAGDLTYAQRLQALGAAHVVCVDKEPMAADLYYGLLPFQGYFSQVLDCVERLPVAFVSWPWGRNALPALLAKSDTVIYLGHHDKASACGSRGFWEPLFRRPLVCEVPHRRNTLLIYTSGDVERPLVAEERAARWCWFEQQLFVASSAKEPERGI
jgi:hypothetical protein